MVKSNKVLNQSGYENFTGCHKDTNIPSFTNEIYDVGIKKYNPKVPTPDVCIGPKCLLPQNKNFQKQKSIQTINSLNITCAEEDDQCINNFKNSYENGTLYQVDDIGFPSQYETNIPPNQVNLYDKTYNNFENMKVKDGKKQMKIKPDVDAFELSKQCLDWCRKSYSCNGVYHHRNNGRGINEEGRAGLVDCYYYDNLKETDLIPASETENDVHIKRVTNYISQVPDGDLNQSWMNNNRPHAISVKKAKKDIEKREKCLEQSREDFENPKPIRYGDTIYLLNLYNTPTYLTACGNRDGGCSDGYSGVKTNVNLNRKKSSMWYITSAQDPPKKKGVSVLTGDLIRLQCKAGNGFLKSCGSKVGDCNNLGVAVTLEKKNSRVNQNIWIFTNIESAKPSRMYQYQSFYIKNYDTEKYLDVCGDARCGNNKYNVIRANQQNRDGNSGKWQLLIPGKNACVNTEFGCCPGTTISKEVVCECKSYIKPPQEEEEEQRINPIEENKLLTAKNKLVPNTDKTCRDWSLLDTQKEQRQSGLPNNVPLVYPLDIYWNGNRCIDKEKYCCSVSDNNLSKYCCKNYFKEEENIYEKCPQEMCRKTCTENMCKIIDERIFNCALSGRDIGDPYSYYNNSNKKFGQLGSRRCLTSGDCVIDERCVNNTCMKVDPNYYNTLLGGGVKMADLKTNSGPNIMRFRFQESFENRRDWWNYKNFLFFIIFGIVVTTLFFRIVRRK